MQYPIQLNGQTLTPPYTLTDSQQFAIQHLADFLHQPINTLNQESYLLLLSGSAGTGKTSILKLLVQYNNKLGSRRRQIVGGALTHKARKVLDNTINKNCFIKIPTYTVSRLLKKVKKSGYIGTKKFKETGSIIGTCDVVLLDEVSMISDKDFENLVYHAMKGNTKIIFIGDSAQIPHPTQNLVEYDGKLEKKDSAGFSLKNHVNLVEVMRQSTENPISEIYQIIRNDLRVEEDKYKHLTMLNSMGHGIVFCDGSKQFLEIISEYFYPKINEDNLLQIKVVTYTNNSVVQYNKIIRNLVFKEKAIESFIVGDVLMGYENVGWPDYFIENGQEYIVKAVRHITDHAIKNDVSIMGVSKARDVGKPFLGNAEGHLILIEERNVGTDGDILRGAKVTVFFPDVHSEQNYPIFQELIKRADKVNTPGSSKDAFKQYQNLKEQLLFKEAMYKWKDEILGETEFKQRHGLLSTKITDVITETVIKDSNGNDKGAKRSILTSDLVKEIEEKYPGLIRERLRDTNILGESEELGDRYKILHKDVDYGFCLTGHKSQGSTYKTVMIDLNDFDKIRDRWNYRFNKWQRGAKEKNQLKYVALTRAKEKVIVLSSCDKEYF